MFDLYGLVRRLIVLLLLMSVFELFYPSDNMRRYSRLVMGMLIIYSILQPILHLADANLIRFPSELLEEYTTKKDAWSRNIMQNSRKIREEGAVYAKDLYDRAQKSMEDMDNKERYAADGIDRANTMWTPRLKSE